MQFGKVDNPENIKFDLPPDAPETKNVLKDDGGKPFEAYVGSTNWNKAYLTGFYPKGTKDELSYYSTQFNSIELNATFYKTPSIDQVLLWKNKTTEDFKFFPKISSTVSHFRRLKNIKEPLSEFCDSVSNFEEKLGMVFLQLRDSFKPKDFDRLNELVIQFPKSIPLAVELRNEEWYKEKRIHDEIFELFKCNKITNVIVDTAGRRDILHMKLTTPVAFIRFVASKHVKDYERLDEWVDRIVIWKKEGLQKLCFFVHQNIEKESPLLSAHLIKKLNETIGTDLKIPKMVMESSSFL